MTDDASSRREILGEMERLRARLAELAREAGVPPDEGTERTQQELARSEQRYRALMEHAGVGIGYYTPDGVLLMLNDVAAAHLGAPADEFIGSGIVDIFGPEHGARYAERIARAARTKQSDTYEDEVELPGGAMCFSSVYTPILDASGDVDGVQIIAQETTERRRMEDELRRTVQRLREAEALAHVGHWEYDLVDDSTAWSDEVYRIYGARRDTPLTLEAVREFTHPEDRDRAPGYTRRAMAGIDQAPYEGRIIRPDGSVRWISGTSKVETDAEGKPTRLYGVVQDITDRKEAERALQASETRYRNLFEHSPVSLWEKDFSAVKEVLDGLEVDTADELAARLEADPALVRMCLSQVEILDVNRATLDLFGAETEPQLRRNRDELFTDESPHVFRDELVALWDPAGNGSFQGEMTVRTLSGEARECAIYVGIQPGSEHDWSNVLVCMVDVTERKRLAERLLQAQKLEAIGQLAGGVAHDFNNILTGILGYARFLQSTLREDSPEHGDAGEIIELGQRAADLTQQLLGFSRRQMLHPTLLNLNFLVSGMLKMLRRLIGENIELNMEAGEASLTVNADQGQLQQVVMNLVVNARDALPEGGTITLRTALADAARVGAAGAQPDAAPCALLEVEDDGTGMDEATIARIFDPFFTTHRRGRGTGLGLAAVYGIVKQHGGDVTVQSAPGRGSVFRVWLPLGTVPAGAEEEPEEPDDLPRGTETVLVVEDEDPVREVVERILATRGYTVLAAASVAEAEQIFAEHADAIDALVSDVVLGDGTGTGLHDALRERQPGLRALFVTGYAEKSMLPPDLGASDATVLGKPFDAAQLVRELRRTLDGEGTGP